MGWRTVQTYPPLAVEVATPVLSLRGATDELLAELGPVVRAGDALAEPAPFDDPTSLDDDDPEARVEKWLRAIWRGRGTLTEDYWQLHFVVVAQGRVVGMQDLIGQQFGLLRSVTTFSWLARPARGLGLGHEMRAAALHLAFDGLEAELAESEAFADHVASNRVSASSGYQTNGTAWASRQGSAAVLHRWHLTRADWLARRRDDIQLHGVPECRASLGLALRSSTPRP